MGYNPRKIERAAYLYDYKLSVLKRGNSPKDLNPPEIAAKSTVIELLWPTLATAMAESEQVEEALNKLLGMESAKGMQEIVDEYSVLAHPSGA